MTYGYKSLPSNKFARIVSGCLMLMVMTFATTFNVQGQTILSEDLRSGEMPTSWTATDVEFTTSASGYAKMTGTTGVLTSPSFDLSGVASATLQFSVAKFGSGDNGPLTVEFSIDGGANWDAFTANSDTATSSTYLNEEITLASNLIGEANVMVRFTTANSASFKRLRDVLIVGPAGVTLDPATEVATIAELRAGTADGSTRYRLTGEAVIAFYDSFNKRRYLVDGTAGIYSEDPGNLPDSLTNIGDGITGIEGTLSLVNNGALLRFNPDAGSTNLTVTTGNELTPETINLADVSLDDTGKLVTIPGVSFQQVGAFSTGNNYTIEDGEGNTMTFRTDYYGADYIGETIPTGKLNITGLVSGYGTSVQVFARSSADFEEAEATPVTVTFRVNTSTIPDTLGEDGFVQLRGNFIATLDSAAYGAQQVTWGSESTPVAMNDGGDYWSVDFTMASGDTLVYKYFAGHDMNTGVNGNGWESGDNYMYVLPEGTSEDVVLDVEYFNAGNGRVAPFTSESDSLTLFFRVNVGAQIQDDSFNPTTHKVGIRGSGSFFTNDWGAGDYLTKGGESGNNTFYEGAFRVQKDSAANINDISYKFVIEDESGGVNWEGTDNRGLSIPAQDSTIHWVYFNNAKPVQGELINSTVGFEVNVGILEGLGLFNPSFDSVEFKGQGKLPAKKMDFNSRNGVYELKNQAVEKIAVGAKDKYKYFIRWANARDSVDSDLYLPGIDATSSGWEEPGITGGTDRLFTYQDVENHPVVSEFYNGVEPEALITADKVTGGAVTVTFSIDMNPAMSHTTPFVPSNDSVYLLIDTPFFALTNGLSKAGDDNGGFLGSSDDEKSRLQFQDPDGDKIYTLELELVLPTLNHIGFRIGYGEPTSEDGIIVANGGGFDAGRRYYQYISPQVDASGNVTWPSTFSFPQLTWTEKNLLYETPPNYQAVSNESELATVESFRLEQNYPNPFNPSTSINFKLPNAANVNLTVYNVLGQRVATLLNNKAFTSGSHSVSFDASNLASGIYIYRLEAGSFTSQKRMTLIK